MINFPRGIVVLLAAMIIPSMAQAHCKGYHPHHCAAALGDAIYGGAKKRAKMVWEDPIGSARNPIKIIDNSIPSPMSYVDYLSKNPDEVVKILKNPTAGVVGLPFAMAISDGRNSALRHGVRKMPANVRAAMAPYFSDSLMNSVRFANNSGLFEGILQGIALKYSAHAITLVNVIVFRNDRPENSPGSKELWAHEMFHVGQYKSMGLSEFSAAYTLRPTTNGNIERPAYDFGRHYINMRNKRVVANDMLVGLGGKCLVASRDAKGASVQLQTCKPSNNLHSWTPTLSGEFRTPKDLCLDVRGGKSKNRTPLQVYPCNGTKSQQFEHKSNGQIRNVLRKNLCLEAAGGRTADGTAIQVFDCNGSISQQWKPAMVTIIATRNNRCLRADSKRRGSPVRLANCSKSDSQQQWAVFRNQGPLHLVQAPGLCLDVPGGRAKNGNKLQVYDCNRSRSQIFIFSKRKELRSALARSICIDVPGGNPATQKPVQIFSCNNTSAQQWNLP
jgi:Ricin-type beta-trefoil lectin domain/Domain of unknown function (DUF4157)